jgi:hypothetical protein
MHLFARHRRLCLQPFDRIPDPVPHRRTLAIAFFQQVLRQRRGFEHGIGAVALLHEERHPPDIDAQGPGDFALLEI